MMQLNYLSINATYPIICNLSQDNIFLFSLNKVICIIYLNICYSLKKRKKFEHVVDIHN